jgi:hypothetical protein
MPLGQRSPELHAIRVGSYDTRIIAPAKRPEVRTFGAFSIFGNDQDPYLPQCGKRVESILLDLEQNLSVSTMTMVNVVVLAIFAFG